MSQDKGSRHLIARKTLKSNDCLALTLSYAYDRATFEKRQLRRLNRRSRDYFHSESPVLNIFFKPVKKLTINSRTENGLAAKMTLQKLELLY